MQRAWLTAALTRAAKLPALATLLRPERPRGQTPAELRAALETLSQQYGIPLRRAS